uniref:Uncharacterized protein n=1 Tax=Meloidogyne floridensis TaxID=298350 RepID=A0A915P2Q4_9BILA
MLKTIFILFLIYLSTNSNPISTEAYTNEDFLFPNRYKREEPKTCSKCPLTINGVSTLMSTAISGFQSGAAQLCSLNTTTEENCVETTNNIAGILRQKQRRADRTGAKLKAVNSCVRFLVVYKLKNAFQVTDNSIADL